MKLIPSFSRPFLVAGPREAGADAKRFEASEIPSISLSNHGREVTLHFRPGFQSLLLTESSVRRQVSKVH